LESLKSVIIENVSHKHAYVRKNALLCIVSITNNFGVDVLPESLKTTLRDIVEKDSDITCKRNAYLALARIDQKESFEVTYELLTNTDVNEIGDLFLLSLVENLRNISLNFPNLKGRILKLFYDLANHKSHSVLFEVANSLITLSSNPNIIKVAVGIFCNLLVEQKDNNILIIILKKLMNIKNRYMDILEENILSFAIILNTTSNSEIRKLLFDLIIELLRESNICQVFDVFINDLNKLRGSNDSDSNIQIKNMILNCIHKGLKRFPKTKETYAIFLLERTILYNSKGTFIDEQINIMKDLFYIFTDLRKEFIKKISQNFEDINNAQILQLIFWLVAEFIEDDLDLIKKFYIMTMKNMGDLNFEVTNEEQNLTKKEAENSSNEKKMITKTVILPDGTYGTKQIYLESSEINKQKENKFLRNFILETDFFFSTNMIMALTRLIIKINNLDLTEKKEIYNTFFYNTINIICAILKIKSNKIFKDPHNISRINFCLECLINNELDLFNNIINESREVYNEYYSKLISEDDNNFNKDNKIKLMVKNVDDYLNFRYVKNPELEGIDIDDDKCKNEDNYINSNTNSKFGSKNGNKFIEVITGSEVKNIYIIFSLFLFSYFKKLFIINIYRTPF
jgi:coatomer subunit beta